MDIITFEKKGINFKLIISGLDRYGKMNVEWKVEGKGVVSGNNRHSDDGFYNNGEFDRSKSAVVFSRVATILKLNGKKVTGVLLEGDVLKKFIETEEKLKTERKNIFEETVNKIVSGEIKIEWYDTTEWFDGYDYPVKKYKLDIPKELNQWEIQREALNRLGLDVIESSTTNYIEKSIKNDNDKVGEMKLHDIVKERIENKKAREERLNNLFKKAKETGEKQEICHYTDDCNDENEECEVDHVYEYAMPDGTRKIERHHTW